MRHVHLLIKPSSGLCDLRCRYCFYHDITEKRSVSSYGFMSEETLEAVLREGLSFAEKELTVAFQGGEPTLIGLDFFRKAVALQKKLNTRRIPIHNAIQTNGMCLTEEWAVFLKENNFLTGISLDGIKQTHDQNRIDAHGEGTFQRVMDAIRLLERHGVDFNVLTVVNRQTAKKIQSIYNFYKKQNLPYLQFIPCLDPLGEEAGQRGYSLSPKEYGRFLCTLFDLWYRDAKQGQAVSIRQFENYVAMLLGYPPEECGMSGICGYQHVVEADGSVYPCDFYVLDAFRLGKIPENTLAQINARREELGFRELSAIPHSKCRTCPYAPLCRGGCRRHRAVSADGSLGLNRFCESYALFFPYALPRLRELAGTGATRQAR